MTQQVVEMLLRESLLDVSHEVLYISAAIQDATNALKNRAVLGYVVAFEQGREFLVCFGLHGFEFRPGSLEFIPFRCFLEKHVQFEHFFEQFRRNIFRSLLADIESFLRQQVLRPLNGIT